ncbi:MAG: hypothetical protein LBT91_01685 [Bifidobacteriaceae bacterium]|jgi:hypothetical protein|nr:hypothetical protein [Bifidobacteriaceae bacterium]
MFIFGWTANVFAASSSTVLPIARGGTNANTAAQAAANILGSNFANHSGVLPISRGGTNSANNLDANVKLGGTHSIQYTGKNSSNSFYFKIASIAVDGQPGQKSSAASDVANSCLIQVVGTSISNQTGLPPFNDYISSSGFLNGSASIEKYSPNSISPAYYWYYDKTAKMLSIWGRADNAVPFQISIYYIHLGKYLESNLPIAETSANITSTGIITDSKAIQWS